MSAAFAARRDATVEAVRRELRRLIRRSGVTQRRIEEVNGFTRGYLSQVLRGRITLTVEHLFGVLHALDEPPGRFFDHLFRDEDEPPIDEIRERMARYDAALRELEERGLLAPEGPSGPERDAE